MVHEIPGHHMNMLDEPQVQVLATELRTALDEARAQAAETTSPAAESVRANRAS